MIKRIVFAASFVLLIALPSVHAQTKDFFFELVKNGSPSSVQNAISNGADVNARAMRDLCLPTPLMIAARYNQNPKVIATLLEAGANVNDTDGDETALMYAAKYNQKPEVITILLKAGADVNARSTEGDRTPLICAAMHNNPEVINTLLKAGANHNENGLKSLMAAAAYNENPQVILVLLKAGADVNARSDDGLSPLIVAAAYNTTEIINTLLKAGARTTEHDHALLMYAAKSNKKPDVIKMLLRAGADVNGSTGFIIRLLRGPLNVHDKSDQTPLMYAAGYNQNPEVITILLKAGANVNARDKEGQTPLMYAAELNDNAKVILTLLKAGADVNACDNFGHTALMFGAMYHYPEVITALLKAGADVNARDKNGATSLMYAAKSDKNPNVITMLQTHRTPILIAGNPDVVTILLKVGADATAKDGQGHTAFDYTARNDKLEPYRKPGGGKYGRHIQRSFSF